MTSKSVKMTEDEIHERDKWEAANPLNLVGGNRPYHVMSVLAAEHSNSRGIFGFLTLFDANRLRLVCKEMRDEMREFRWKDIKTRINGRLDLWRACFPYAISANLNGRVDLDVEDFLHLRGIRHLNLSAYLSGRGHTAMTFPDASFEHIHGIQSLDIAC